MKKLIQKFVVIVVLISLLISCTKESPIAQFNDRKREAVQGERLGDAQQNLLPITLYYCCGMMANIVSINAVFGTTYSFAINQNNQNKKFGIDNYGQINFNYPDWFSYEFAGYADPAHTIHTWRIKRTDGKYLTTQPGNGMAYLNKLNAPQDIRQIFLLSYLGNKLYKFLLPKMTDCNVAALYFDIDRQNYIFTSFTYNSPRLVSSISSIVILSRSLPLTM